MYPEEVRQHVLEKRYLLPNETEDEMYMRVAEFIGRDDKQIKGFYWMMSNGLFLPNSPCLMNAGTSNPMLSACFVLPIEDDLAGIFEAVKNAAIVHKFGGGTGFSFSRLRPNGDIVHGTNGVASGPISFMRVFDAATEQVKQGGKRRGANMGVLNISHPDVEEFIKCKRQEGELSNFNISVAVTNDFLGALERGKKWQLRNPRDGQVWKEVKANELFDEIAKSIWINGEPGVLFIDRINELHTCRHLGWIEATNPCGEQPLLPYESCDLGSINLSKMASDNEVDWKLLEKVTRLAVQFLDNVIDRNRYPLPEIEKVTKRTRKIGLGVMGWHDMLLKLGIPYDSEEAIKLAKEVMYHIEKVAIDESIRLAEEYSVFPAWEDSTWEQEGIKIRNATLTTIAPTGSISMIAGCSPSIEPVFSFAFVRSHIVEKDKKAIVVHPLFRKYVDEDVIKEVLKSGTTQLDIIPEDIRRLFKGALDIHWKWHIDMQAVFQEFTHNAVSKTINMPQETTVEEIKKAILYAYERGCKGITIYRSGSRVHEVMSVDRSKRPRALNGVTFSARSGCGKMYVTINERNGRPYEVFVKSAGGCEANNEAIGRLISLALRNGIPVERVIRQLRKVKCINAMRSEKSEGRSCADVIGKLLEEVSGREIKVERCCPECGAKLTFGEGCMTGSCPNCGWSGCNGGS